MRTLTSELTPKKPAPLRSEARLYAASPKERVLLALQVGPRGLGITVEADDAFLGIDQFRAPFDPSASSRRAADDLARSHVTQRMTTGHAGARGDVAVPHLLS